MTTLLDYSDRSAKINPYKRDWLPTILIATLIAITLAVAHFAIKVNEQRAEIAELAYQIEQARLTKKRQCWITGGRGEPVVELCATPWRGF